MKKAFLLTLIIALLLSSLNACKIKNEVSRTAVDWSYTAPYDGVETDYVYKYNVIKGEFVLVPEVKTVHHDAVYKILFHVTFDDGSTDDIWEIVTAAEYEEVSK